MVKRIAWGIQALALGLAGCSGDSAGPANSNLGADAGTGGHYAGSGGTFGAGATGGASGSGGLGETIGGASGSGGVPNSGGSGGQVHDSGGVSGSGGMADSGGAPIDAATGSPDGSIDGGLGNSSGGGSNDSGGSSSGSGGADADAGLGSCAPLGQHFLGPDAPCQSAPDDPNFEVLGTCSAGLVCSYDCNGSCEDQPFVCQTPSIDAVGAPCPSEGDLQCDDSTLYCSFDAGQDEQSTFSACAKRGAQGEGCDELDSTDPYSSLNCGRPDVCLAGLQCLAGKCAALPVTKGGRCDCQDDCADGLICDLSKTPFVCTALFPSGHACDTDSLDRNPNLPVGSAEAEPSNPCAAGMACIPKTVFSCAGVAKYTPCTKDSDCQFGGVPSCAQTAFSFCGPAVKVGAACSSNDECATGLICDTTATQPVCSAPLPSGHACSATAMCGGGLVCNDTHQPATCTPPQPVGEPCNGHVTCATGLCVNKVCTAPGGLGGSCAAGCASGLTCDRTQSPSVCAKPFPAGHECEEGSDCASGLFCDGNQTPARCNVPFPEGHSCKLVDACASGLVCNITISTGTSGICTPHCPLGGRCFDNHDCQSGLTCSAEGTCVKS